MDDDSNKKDDVQPNVTVSIIIVNYNNSEDTNECLSSIAEVPFDDYEIIVIDNNSEEEVSKLINPVPNTRLFRTTKNVGFAQGCNIGAKQASGEYLFFLNNDALVTEGLFPALICHIRRNQNTAAVVPHVLFNHNRTEIDTGLSTLDNLGFGWHPNHLADVESDAVPTDPCEIPWGSGCALLVDRAAFEEIGGFDGQFFMYKEDLELGLRLRKAGYTIYLIPQAIVYHKFSRSVKDELDLDRSPFQTFHEQRNRAKLLTKHYPARILLSSLPAIVGSFIYWDFFLAREKSLSEGLQALIEQICYARRGITERSDVKNDEWTDWITVLSIFDYLMLAINRKSFYTGEFELNQS